MNHHVPAPPAFFDTIIVFLLLRQKAPIKYIIRAAFDFLLMRAVYMITTLIKKNHAAGFSCASIGVLLIGAADYYSGWELGFFVFYFIPIAFAAWYIGRKSGIVLAVFAGLTWIIADFFLTNHYSSPFFAFWNSFIRLISFVLLALLLTRIRHLLVHEKQISRDLQFSLDHIKRLKGMLPICASCKKVRNDKGYWEQIEKYLCEHSEAEFTHGLCPECTRKLYPELSERMEQSRNG
ncbi:MAG: DUF4118 domain-containing protein [Chitinispirillaceae bacterium]|nr:DUF4118 domain-containing protein [Chitinispirillaceae bacterium]